jgi:hypothetical protein
MQFLLLQHLFGRADKIAPLQAPYLLSTTQEWLQEEAYGPAEKKRQAKKKQTHFPLLYSQEKSESP